LVNKSPAKTDALLEPLLSAADEEQADERLSQLITVQIAPVVRGVIRCKLHFNPYHAAEQAEADDIQQEVTLQLLAQLRKFRLQPRAHPIGDVRGLAAVIAQRSCARWMRRRFPERHALKNHLYYLLTRQSGFGLWQNENRKLMAGFAAWRGRSEAATAERLKSLSGDQMLLARIMSLHSAGRQADSSDVLAAVFNHLGGPVEFDELVRTLAELLPVRDRPVESADENQNAVALASAAGATDTAWQVEKRIFLERLWEEVRELPLNQRAALLLNLKDADGRGCIALFPAAGIATVRQLAETLEMGAAEFSELWNELPIEDARIADLFRMTRQQVINARKSARERLARRLRGFI
jgi:hypothetical protein